MFIFPRLSNFVLSRVRALLCQVLQVLAPVGGRINYVSAWPGGWLQLLEAFGVEQCRVQALLELPEGDLAPVTTEWGCPQRLFANIVFLIQ